MTLLQREVLHCLQDGSQEAPARMHQAFGGGSVSQDFSAYLQGTKANSLVDAQGEKTTLSIRSTLVSKISSLEYLPDTSRPFSIKDWILDDCDNNDQWLFLSATQAQVESIRPLLTTWLDVAISSLMQLEKDEKRRLWYVLDELPKLNRIPSLSKGLAELRKYGGCVVTGFQNISQLEDIYGHSQAAVLVDQCNTKVIFRSTDPKTCEFLSKLIGEKEVKEVQENHSYGANSIRDGVSLNEVQKVSRLVLPTELAQLSNLECFVQLPENLPSTKLQMRYKAMSNISEPFVPRDIKCAV